MNLAAQDIRHHLARLGATAFGIGLLLMIVLSMSGIYGGLVYEVTLLVNHVDADLLVHGFADGARRQLGLFRGVLVAVSVIIMTLILYTLTLEKTHDIAMLSR